MRRLSTNWTWFYKVPFPLAWSGVCGYVALRPFVLSNASPLQQGSDDWIILVLALLTTAYVFYLSSSVKYVYLDGAELAVGGYLKTIHIPLQDVERVWGGSPLSRAISGKFIHLETRVPTAFGTRIVFIPRFRISYGQHPFVQELSDAARAAKGLPP